MSPLLPPWPLLSAFLVASLILAVTPGPAVFYIVTRSLLQGRHAGLASVAGVALGSLGNAIGAALGLAALLTFAPTAFALLKYTGAFYLVYLGIQALRTPEPELAALHPEPAHLGRIFRDGLVVALFNPQTAIFFAAFLPQFLSTDATPSQSVALGSLFVAIAASTDVIYALAAGAVAPHLARGARSLGRYLGAAGFIGLGVLALFADIHGGA